MDMQTTIELIALVVSAIGLGIYIGRRIYNLSATK